MDPFQTHRPRLLSLAYRVLGSFAEAEDVVQDAHVRWLSRAQTPLDSDRAWLERVVMNLCLDQLKSARARRETYVGTWLPEPVMTDAAQLTGVVSVLQLETDGQLVYSVLVVVNPDKLAHVTAASAGSSSGS